MLLLLFSRSVVSDSATPWTVAQPGSSVHGISQAGIWEWVAISFSRGSHPPRDRTHLSCIDWWAVHRWATREALDAAIAYVNSPEFSAGQEMGACTPPGSACISSAHSPSPSYLSWLQPLVEPPSAGPACEQEEQEDCRGLGCHRDGRVLTETSMRSWGTVVAARVEGEP